VSEFAVTAVGRDQPGIVAAISGALLEVDGNIQDSQMSILRGHFAVMLIVEVPDSIDEAELRRRLQSVGEGLGLEAIAVNGIDDLGGPAAPPSHVISVYGADHPGIVHAAASALAEHQVNITGLETRLTGPADSPLYVMIIEVAVGEAPESEVRDALSRVGEEAGVEVTVRPLEAEAL
jgi:glycine cleavage system transcriptional repressor